jgi:hypothetical protein
MSETIGVLMHGREHDGISSRKKLNFQRREPGGKEARRDTSGKTPVKG